MASILLINENKIVSRLLKLSSEKNGYKIKEVSNIDEVDTGSYDVVFIDNDSYSDTILSDLSSKVKYNQLGYIGAKQEDAPKGFSLNLEKPFLPTDFVDMIKEKVVSSKPQETTEVDSMDDLELGEEELLVEDDTFELDELDMDELSLDDDIDSDIESETLLETLEDELDVELGSLDEELDLSLDPSTMMTTGIAASMATTDNPVEELSEMVSDIDAMEIEESNVLETLEESLPPLDETEKESDMGSIAAVAGLATNALSDDKAEVLEDLQEEILDLNDIDSLNESDLQAALGEEVTEEIINEEVVVDGEETLVESNDVEKWIRDAVAKAITPAMIQEALNGMDINVNLTFKNKDNTPS